MSLFVDVIECSAVPAGEVLLLNLRCFPDGKLDLIATAKASAVIRNIELPAPPQEPSKEQP